MKPALAAALTVVDVVMSEISPGEKRELVGEQLLTVLEADKFASYVCDRSGPYADRVGRNIDPALLDRYDRHFRYVDRLTPTLFRARRVSRVVADERNATAAEQEFIVDFLHRADMYSGINYFSGLPRLGSFDLRFWRDRKGRPFNTDDARQLQTLGDLLDRTWPTGKDNLSVLTQRERSVAEQVALGRTDRQVGQSLRMSQGTLRTHLGRVFRKLDVESRAGVAAAVSRGIGRTDDAAG
jgi:DNA-binding CsgD family transcriptional regulator